MSGEDENQKKAEDHPNIRLLKKGVLDNPVKKYEKETQLVKAGCQPEAWTTDPLGRSVVNPPVYHNSTVTFETMDSFLYGLQDIPFMGMWYGLHGNPTSWALEEAFATIEGGYSSCAVSSGLAANNVTIMAFTKAGGHMLISEGAYFPTKLFLSRTLQQFNVEFTTFDPKISADEFKDLMRENTTLVYLESPTTFFFEISDVTALTEVAHEGGAIVMCDNSYGPTLFRPHDHGCDVVTNAATKYVNGHSDVIIGLISARDETSYRRVKTAVTDLGYAAGPDDCYLALRGLRTMGVRLGHQGPASIEIATWLEQQEEIDQVLHPALPSHPQHELFKRDFSGCAGTFGFKLNPFPSEAVNRMVENMKLFSFGFSWGGYESMIMRGDVEMKDGKWQFNTEAGSSMRLSIGLENVEDLKEDLRAALNYLREYKPSVS